MAANRQVREALIAKTGWSRQQLSWHAKRLNDRLPTSTDNAVHVLAHHHGVPVGRYLDPDSMSRVTDYVSRLNAATSPSPAPRPRASSVAPKEVAVTIAGVKVGQIPGLTPRHAQEAKVMAEKIYPALYLFENSARDVITRVMKAKFGDSWWDHVPAGVSNQAEQNIEKEGKEAWHGKRSNNPIDYVDLPQLAFIVMDDALWPLFKPLFNRKNWFEGLVQDLNVSRRVAAHMNPLAADDIQGVEVLFRKWVKQMQARASLLP